MPVDQRLRDAIEDGRIERVADAYAPGARLEAALPGRSVRVEGPEAIVDEVATWWSGPGRLDHWDVLATTDGGYWVMLERSSTGEGPVERHRQYHHIHLDAEGRVERHQVFCDRPQLGEPPEIGEPTPSFLRDALERSPYEHAGLSGSWLERVVLADGRAVIVKHISADWDWMMRATGDTGREATLWLDGVMAEVDDVVRYPAIAAEREGNGWAIALQDVSDMPLPPGAGPNREQARRVLLAADAMHRRFEGREFPQACSLADCADRLSPAMSAAERNNLDVLPKYAGMGWERLPEHLEEDLASAVLRLVEDPTPLVNELCAEGTTLLHGDWRHSNLALDDQERVIALDWAASAQGPPEVEFLSYLVESSTVGGWLDWDQTVEDWKQIRGADFDQRRFDLATLFELVLHGWKYGAQISYNVSSETRATFAKDLAWITDRARQALERWTPVWPEKTEPQDRQPASLQGAHSHPS